MPRSFYIPKGACKVADKSGLGEVYLYITTHGKLGAVGFGGKAQKPSFHYTFRTEERRREYVANWFAGLAGRRERVAGRRKEASEPHSIKPGAIITNSWGYDQTNVDWYVVTATSRNFVTLRPIAAQTTPEGGCGPMSGHCEPRIDVSDPDPMKWGIAFTGPEFRAKADKYNNVCMKYGSGSIWDGKPKYESWYA